MLIRPINPDEAEQVGELIVAAYVAGEHLQETDSYAATLRNAAARLDYTLVAVEGGRVVGTICLCPPDGVSPAVICHAGEYEFRFLAISPDEWSAGIGQALVAECEARAIAFGSSRMVISVIDTNLRALEFYARQGYVRVPERDWSPVIDARTGAVGQIRILALSKKLPSR